ncbi:MAG: 3-deoxy-D-manno-octulosonic acid transferase [Alphaproteobacteria bacterium]|nr:3-deoxy-D-manno-octulosonic acid transferase [Alphaproteobacteria bacterium]
MAGRRRTRAGGRNAGRSAGQVSEPLHVTEATTPLEPTFGLKAYQSISKISGPIARLALARRLAAGKEDPDRIAERHGECATPRPAGALIWIHGASVGESLSVLPLVERFRRERPGASFLVTTGTITSARLMAERLPAGAIHQFAPLDHPVFVRRFLDHWRPDAAIFVESEFWPNLLTMARERAPLLALVNGRVSPRSFESWTRRLRTIKYLLSVFDVMIAQDKKNAERLARLSGRQVESFGNLKNAAPPLPCDDNEIRDLKRQVGARPIWLAASTHPSEEEIVFDAHKLLLREFPDLLTVIAPRHPERGAEVADLVRAVDLTPQRRSREPRIAADCQVYVADTLGELGLFYRLSSVAFVGGSLLEKGGHNPLEPARLGCAILHGPHTFNFDETYAEMRGGGGAALVRNERDLATAVRRLLADEKTRLAMAGAARVSAESSAERVLTSVAAEILARLPDADAPSGDAPSGDAQDQVEQAR